MAHGDWPRDQTQVSCIAGKFFTILATREAPIQRYWIPQLETQNVLPPILGPSKCHLSKNDKKI